MYTFYTIIKNVVMEDCDVFSSLFLFFVSVTVFLEAENILLLKESYFYLCVKYYFLSLSCKVSSKLRSYFSKMSYYTANNWILFVGGVSL